MPLEIIRNDITKLRADAIVNTANPEPIIGAGVDLAIHRKAGKELLEARKKIGSIAVGTAALTPAFRLPAKFVIHTAGPVWQDGLHEENRLLRSCYESSLFLAEKNGCESIAFPLISTGNYGFPKDIALQTATDVIRSFLKTHEMTVYLVVFDENSFSLSKQLEEKVKSYIDKTYVAELEQFYDSYPSPSRRGRPLLQRDSIGAPPDLDKMIQSMDSTFSQELLKKIDETGKSDPEIYKKANIDRKHFSKIRNNPNYRPTKGTALAFAFALELDLEETKMLIGKAGYALTHSSKTDIIVEYFIREQNYDIFSLNETLFAFGENTLP